MFSFSRGYGAPQATQVGNNAAATGANTSRNTASQLLRKQQITMLFKENETVRETKSGVYQIGLMLADKKTIITLRIALGDGFPVSAPVLQIMTHATHPWLSNDGYCRVVGHPELVNWNPHCNLGKIVKETVQEFCERPPILVKTPLTNTKRTALPQQHNQSMHNQSMQHGGSSLHPGQPSGKQTRTGPALKRSSSTFNLLDNASLPNKIAEIDAISGNDKISILLEDEAALKSFVQTLNCVRNWDGVLEDQLKMNLDKAKSNLEYEDDLNVKAVDIFKLQTSLKEETKLYKEHLKRREAIEEQFKPAKVARIVEASCGEAEQSAMELVDNFLDEEIELKAFVKSHMKAKTAYHRRKALLERFKVTHGV